MITQPTFQKPSEFTLTTLARLRQSVDYSPQPKLPGHVRIFYRVMTLLLTLITILMATVLCIGISNTSHLALCIASFLACCALLSAVIFLISHALFQLPSGKQLEKEYVIRHNALVKNASVIESKAS
ncbi:hypothetical protein [Chlamydia sp. 17-3921]|uniref:hypothetical protein n=1 Tax=Chlamydia sp. 17-3921 TaxID=2675798 RepID=UPI001919AB46|nr:hypothetical protein [Chlamydia sp. 17-3921]